MALESLSEAIARLGTRGFRHSLRACGNALRVVETGDLIEPEKLQIDEVVRFEGETDPAEELVLLALTGPGGEPLGTYTTMYGPATPPEDAAVLHRLREASPARLVHARGRPVDSDPRAGRS